MMNYCYWDSASDLDREYHNKEWGIPVRDDKKQFEYLLLETMQCGLSWELMLKKREIFRECYDNFDYDKIASYNEEDVVRIMNTDGMIRSERKIRAIINNARCFQQICKDYGSFCNYLWGYSGNKTIVYEEHNKGKIPVSNGLSDKISKDLKKYGFKFIGSIVIYSHLQACGIINDHDCNCPRYKEIISKYPIVYKKQYQEKF